MNVLVFNMPQEIMLGLAKPGGVIQALGIGISFHHGIHGVYAILVGEPVGEFGQGTNV